MKDKPVQPLQEIDDVEEDVPKLFHLGCMDFFVVENIIRFSFEVIGVLLSDKQATEQIDCYEPFEGNDGAVDDFHYSS